MDVTINISLSDVSYKSWLHTSYVGKTIAGKDGASLIETIELGIDQEDIFTEFINQAAFDINKMLSTRQGDAEGVPFEKTSTDVTYRFLERVPYLKHSATIKSILADDIKEALFTYVTALWFNSKSMTDNYAFMQGRYEVLKSSITSSLYLLHD